MRKTLALFGAGLLAASLTQPVKAADLEYERQLGLIVSGVVDKWAGVQVIDVDTPDFGPVSDAVDISFFDYPIDGDQTEFASGGEGTLSLPLADNLSIQSDVKYEYNGQAFDSIYKSTGPRYWYQGAVHLSWRDPMTGLFGVFGGMGGSSNGFPLMGRQDYRFVGGEAQFYMDMFTFYGQGGYIGLDMRDSGCGGEICVKQIGGGPDEGIFGRGVVRWFPTLASRLQLEGTYLNLTTDFAGGFDTDNNVWSWKARYDFDLDLLPIIGTLPVYLAYRGTLREDCVAMLHQGGGSGGGDLVSHTFMVGTSYSFNGDRLTIDRQGATLDTPDFGNMIGCSVADDRPSDRRLKTDILGFGETDDGIKLYTWKYKSDPVTTWVGVIAQDLEQTHPEALAKDAEGFYRVDYRTLGVRMMTLEQWNTRNL